MMQKDFSIQFNLLFSSVGVTPIIKHPIYFNI